MELMTTLSSCQAEKKTAQTQASQRVRRECFFAEKKICDKVALHRRRFTRNLWECIGSCRRKKGECKGENMSERASERTRFCFDNRVVIEEGMKIVFWTGFFEEKKKTIEKMDWKENSGWKKKVSVE